MEERMDARFKEQEEKFDAKFAQQAIDITEQFHIWHLSHQKEFFSISKNYLINSEQLLQ